MTPGGSSQGTWVMLGDVVEQPSCTVHIGFHEAYLLSRAWTFSGGNVFCLQDNHTIVEPALVEELLMCTLLDNSAGIENQDQISMGDGAEAMGDDERGSPLQQAFQAVLDQAFAFAVEVAGGFVEDQYARVSENRASNG